MGIETFIALGAMTAMGYMQKKQMKKKMKKSTAEGPPAPAPAVSEGLVTASNVNEERRRRIARKGRESTFNTGGGAGLTTTASVQRKTLLGQ